MRFGLTPDLATSPLSRPEFALGYARAAEEFGFDSVWLPDHVVWPSVFASKYPYAEQMPYTGHALPEPLTVLTFMAAVTSRIRLGTSILILPQRNPVVLAKELATLDALSGGRIDLGVGGGWLREEYEALGASWSDRGRRMDEYIEAMRALWTQPEATYEGRTVSFERIQCDPKPVQPGGVPIIIGGHSDAAARRAGRLGNGFIPVAAGGEWRRLVALMRETAVEHGRDPDAIELISGGPPSRDLAQRLEERGVSHMVITTRDSDLDTLRTTLETLAQELLANS
jgi:probable F420-dependent oxidoreductase